MSFYSPNRTLVFGGTHNETRQYRRSFREGREGSELWVKRVFWKAVEVQLPIMAVQAGVVDAKEEINRLTSLVIQVAPEETNKTE